MAECYRNYLDKKGQLKSSATNADAIITMLGGLEERKLFLGIPYHTLSTVTDFEQAKEILSDILKKTDSKLALSMTALHTSSSVKVNDALF